MRAPGIAFAAISAFGAAGATVSAVPVAVCKTVIDRVGEPSALRSAAVGVEDRSCSSTSRRVFHSTADGRLRHRDVMRLSGNRFVARACSSWLGTFAAEGRCVFQRVVLATHHVTTLSISSPQVTGLQEFKKRSVSVPVPVHFGPNVLCVPRRAASHRYVHECRCTHYCKQQQEAPSVDLATKGR